MLYYKIGLACVLLVLNMIIVLQNTEDVQVYLLFWHVKIPMVTLTALIFSLGFSIGVLVSMIFQFKKNQKKITKIVS